MATAKRGKLIYIILGVALALIIIGLVYAFFYTAKCGDIGCFKTKLWECKRATFTNSGENATWYYKINGFSAGECNVYTKAVSLKIDVGTGTALNGKAMNCYIPKEVLGAFMPEEKLEYCHGMLKEEIQRLMIEKMHLYIVQNIGQINQTKII